MLVFALDFFRAKSRELMPKFISKSNMLMKIIIIDKKTHITL